MVLLVAVTRLKTFAHFRSALRSTRPKILPTKLVLLLNYNPLIAIVVVTYH